MKFFDTSPEPRRPMSDYFSPSTILEAHELVPRGEQTPTDSHPHIEAVGVKTVGRCNLNCTYCYELNVARVEVMSYNTIEKVAQAMARYAVSRNISLSTILHGGEPLMTHRVDVPAVYYQNLAAIFAGVASETVEVHPDSPPPFSQMTMQTNATLLTPDIIDTLKINDITVSCSLDGDEVANSLRVNMAGKGTYKETVRGIKLLNETYPEGARGLLAVINPLSDPVACYHALSELVLPGQGIDFMLPYATHDTVPPPDIERYTEWLLAVHKVWTADRLGGKNPPPIRFFNSITNLMRGHLSLTTALGREQDNVVFVRTDGSFEGPDAMKKIEPIVLKAEADDTANPFDVAEEEMTRLNLLGEKPLAKECRKCSIVDICGGGHIANRHRTDRETGETSTDNPSVYCGLLKTVIPTVGIRSSELIGLVEGRRLMRTAEILPSPIPYERNTPNLVGSLITAFRPATLSDVSRIVEIHGASFLSKYEKVWPSDPDTPDIHTFVHELATRKRTYWSELIAYPGHKVLIAMLGNQALAFAAMTGDMTEAHITALECYPDLDRKTLERTERVILEELAHHAFRFLGAPAIYTTDSPGANSAQTLASYGFKEKDGTTPPSPLALTAMWLASS